MYPIPSTAVRIAIAIHVLNPIETRMTPCLPDLKSKFRVSHTVSRERKLYQVVKITYRLDRYIALLKTEAGSASGIQESQGET